MAGKMSTELRKAYEEDDHVTWSIIMARRGVVMPTTETLIRDTFCIARMREKSLPMDMRIDARNELVVKGVVKEADEPLKPAEKLKKKKSKFMAVSGLKKMLADYPEYEEYVLIFPSEGARNRFLIKGANELVGKLDKVRSNVRYHELYTLDGKHIKFLLEDEEFETISVNVAFSSIANVS